MLTFEDLPCEMAFQIFRYLTPRELCEVRHVNKKYKGMIDDPCFYSIYTFQIKSIWQQYIKHRNGYERVKEKRNKITHAQSTLHKRFEDAQNRCTLNKILCFISSIGNFDFFNVIPFAKQMAEFQHINKKINKKQGKIKYIEIKFKIKQKIVYRLYTKYMNLKHPNKNYSYPSKQSKHHASKISYYPCNTILVSLIHDKFLFGTHRLFMLKATTN